MVRWLTEPYGFVVSFLLVALLLMAQAMGWASTKASGQRGLKARILNGMQQSPAGRRWLDHPWASVAFAVALGVIFGVVFNARRG